MSKAMINEPSLIKGIFVGNFIRPIKNIESYANRAIYFYHPKISCITIGGSTPKSLFCCLSLNPATSTKWENHERTNGGGNLILYRDAIFQSIEGALFGVTDFEVQVWRANTTGTRKSDALASVHIKPWFTGSAFESVFGIAKVEVDFKKIASGHSNRIDIGLNIGSKTLQMSIYTGVSIGMSDIENLAITNRTNGNPAYVSSLAGKDRVPFTAPGFDVESGMEMSRSRFAKGTREVA